MTSPAELASAEHDALGRHELEVRHAADGMAHASRRLAKPPTVREAGGFRATPLQFPRSEDVTTQWQSDRHTGTAAHRGLDLKPRDSSDGRGRAGWSGPTGLESAEGDSATSLSATIESS